MQPQANRERIIIRTSLAHLLPPVIADARALRQITLNLIGNSIHLANAGGQVIVSTALSDFGEVVLRVRDTGHGLNDNEVAAAMEPFRTPAPSDQAADSSGVSLSLTKALVEANRARFQIKTGAQFRHADRSGVPARDGAGVAAAVRSCSPLPLGEVGAQRRVRGYGLPIGRTPHPTLSPRERERASVVVIAQSHHELDLRNDRALEFGDARFVAPVERPLPDPL